MISDSYAITAAHCLLAVFPPEMIQEKEWIPLDNFLGVMYYLVLGDHYWVDNDPDSETSIPVHSFILYRTGGSFIDGDVAILRLSTTVKFSKFLC